MGNIIAIALGGSVGALMRFGVSTGMANLFGRGFPYGTMVANVLGCLMMGILYVVMLERMAVAPEWRAAIQTGMLGAFTTFSTFGYETVALIDNREFLYAMWNVVGNLMLGLVAVWLGRLAVRAFG